MPDHYISSPLYTSRLETALPDHSVIGRVNSILVQALIGEASFADAYHRVKEARLTRCARMYRGKLHEVFKRMDAFLYAYLKY